MRDKLLRNLQKYGYNVPVLIHPTAYVSRTATIGIGTVVEPKAIVNANSYIAKGCVISVGSIVDHDVEAGICCHINAGAIVKAGGKVENFRKLEAGEIVLGYELVGQKGMITQSSNDEFAKEYLEKTGKEVSFF